MLKVLCPGLKLVFITSDYHEDDETSHGFHETGDEITLLFIVGIEPVIDSGTRQVVRYHDVWLFSGRWGLMEKDDYYLAAMTKVKDAKTQ